jgi:hypothetical protein
MLSASIRPGSPGAGQRYAWIVLTNTTRAGCLIEGYGGMALQGKPGVGVPTDLVRLATPAPTSFLLGPGESASSFLHWSAVQGIGEPVRSSAPNCEPIAVTALVTPPDQTRSIIVPWTFGPVCEHGMINQEAYAPGAGSTP